MTPVCLPTPPPQGAAPNPLSLGTFIIKVLTCAGRMALSQLTSKAWAEVDKLLALELG